MTDPVYNYNPQGGEIPHGTQVVECNGTLYIEENWTPTRGTTKLRRKDNLGRPNGLKLINEAIDATAVWQLANTETPLPVRGATFQRDGLTYVVEQVSDPRQVDQITVVNVSATERI